jgi:CHAT domain-containing protein
VEWRPIHTVASATVYAEVRKSRRESAGPPTLVAFGDPRYPALAKDDSGRIADAQVRSVVTRGFGLTPIPSTRDEVAAIAALYPSTAIAYLGDQATEERAKSVGKGVRYLHFATHGLLDERFPLNSALAFTIPESPGEGQDNGLLQAWEVFDAVRVDADLVTLSACDTALGAEMGGEGLLGLTRAFQYAGARSVLASLWSVGDESTARLMERFYRYLGSGETKDRALRAAQLDLIRSADASAPFHWAAFQLVGDWK